MVTGSSPLFHLPMELRLRIYNYVVDSTNVLFHPPTLYSGLLGTCREINSELEPELITQATRWLIKNVPNAEAKYFDPRTFKASTLHQLRNLVVLRAPEYLERNMQYGANSDGLTILKLKSLTSSGVNEYEQGFGVSDDKGSWMVTGHFSCFAVSGCKVQEDESDSHVGEPGLESEDEWTDGEVDRYEILGHLAVTEDAEAEAAAAEAEDGEEEDGEYEYEDEADV
jgi:hypothetical protein